MTCCIRSYKGRTILRYDVKLPNATTVKAMRAADKGKGKRLNSAGALFKDLGISSGAGR